jgi:hypothetical protein
MGQPTFIGGIQESTKLFRKPVAIMYWLLTARWSQIAMLLVVLFLPFFVSNVVDPYLEKIYPPIKEEKLLGMVSYLRSNPLLEDRQETAKAILWTISLGWFCFLLILNIPKTIRKTTAIALKRESKADALNTSQPSESMIIYKSALSLTTDPEQETRLIKKIRDLKK